MSVETVDWDGLMDKVRPMLPKGAVVVSPETVAEIKRLRDEADAAFRLAESDTHKAAWSAVVSVYRHVLSLLGAKEEGQ